VNTWLRDNTANHYTLLNKKDAVSKKRLTKLASITISEDEDNYDSSMNKSASSSTTDNKNQHDEDGSKTKSSGLEKSRNKLQLHYQQEVNVASGGEEDWSANNKASNEEDNAASVVSGSEANPSLARDGGSGGMLASVAMNSSETNDSAIDMRSFG
jgi:hypothetical protein